MEAVSDVLYSVSRSRAISVRHLRILGNNKDYFTAFFLLFCGGDIFIHLCGLHNIYW